jgi:hypothetical protein
VAGMLALSWNFFHRFMMMGLLYGKGIAEIAVRMAGEADGVFGLDEQDLLVVLIVLLVIRVLCGALCGLAAWTLGDRIRRRVQREPR